jgi:hypothetical protein
MCNDNLLDVLKSGGDLNDVKTTSDDNLSVVNEGVVPPTYYEINNKKPLNDKQVNNK